MGRSRANLLRAGIGIVISIAALVLAVRGVDLAQTAEVVAGAAPSWVAAMFAFAIADVIFRSIRWQQLIAPIQAVPLSRMAGYLLIGYLANNVLPARLGELVRSHYLGDREGISRTTTLGTVVVERVVDTTVVVAIASVAILVLSIRGVVASAVLVGMAVAGMFIIALSIGIVAHRLPGAENIAARLARWPKVRELGSRLQGGLAVASRPRTLFAALLLSACAWTVSVLGFAAAGQAVGVELTIAQAGLLAAGVALATAVPSGPGYLGTFELAAVEICRSFGVLQDRAFALALLIHATLLIVTSVGGAIALARLGWHRSEPETEPA